MFGVQDYQFTTLVTPGVTEIIGVRENTAHTVAYVTTGVSTDVVLRPQGSLDGSNWFHLNDSRVDTTITSNTTIMDHKDGFAYNLFRVNWVSKSGTGTTPNVAIRYHGSGDLLR